MKRIGKWFISVFAKVLVIILVIVLLPFAKQLISRLMPDLAGEITTQSKIIAQKLESSKRLEVTKIDEEGVLVYKKSVIILGNVGQTTIRYRYTASLGIDLSKVTMTEDSDRIIFTLPDIEVLNDGIEAIEVNKQSTFSYAVHAKTEKILEEQRKKCREQYLTGTEYSERTWDDTQKAFEETLCQWLEKHGDIHYTFEFVRQSE